MDFVPEIMRPPQEIERAFWFIFYNDKLLVHLSDNTVNIPLAGDLSVFNLEPAGKRYLGKLNNCPCYAVEMTGDKFVPKNTAFLGLRKLFGLVEENLFWLAGRAIQVVHWDRTHRYCGRCGAGTYEKSDEYAKVCPECGLASYPRISPVVIVAVVKDKEILLVRSNHFKTDFYTVISGFVEPGETLEECLRREVKEEVGVAVKNISYFGSQSWPFPNSLMVAFTAEYDGGEIITDEEEIKDAKWFTKEDLPDLPNSISIARQLINWFAEKNS